MTADHVTMTDNTNPGNFANRPTEEVKEIAAMGGRASEGGGTSDTSGRTDTTGSTSDGSGKQGFADMDTDEVVCFSWTLVDV